jgi:molecular chaperone HtpG
MRTRLASGAETVTLRWRGRADGTYDVSPADQPLAEPGTEVGLAPSPEATELLEEDAVRHLIDRFGAYLPCEIVLHGREGPEHVGGQVFPWDDAGLTGVSALEQDDREAEAQQIWETWGETPPRT